MTSRIHDQNKKLDERRKPLTERDLAIGLHVIMRQSGWDRFDKGGTLSEDQTSILVDTEDGRQFVVEVREAKGQEPINEPLLEELLHLLTRPIYVWRLARGLLSARPGNSRIEERNLAQDTGAEKRRDKALIEIHDMIVKYVDLWRNGS